MNAFQAFLNILILSIFFSFIITDPSYEDYTSVPLDKIRIGSQSKQISLIINTISSKTVLFTNSKRPYSQQIQKGRKSDVLIDKVSLEGEKIESFPFNLQIDETKLGDNNIQGEFGLGLDSEKSCDFIDILHDNQLISSKVIELEFETGNEDKITLNLNPKVDDFTFCDVSSHSLDSDDFYSEGWICYLSHIIAGSTKNDLIWNNTKEVNSKVVFDSRTKYVYIPKDNMKYIKKAWKIIPEECKIIHELNSDEKYYTCGRDLKSRISQLPSLYFIIDGYGFRLEASDLFEDNGKNLTGLIRFFNDEDIDFFILGMPFLKEHNTVFDYENARIGFKGGEILDYTEEYEKWTKESHEKKEKKSSFFSGWSWEKIIMIIGAIIGTLIIIYVMFWLYRNCKRETSKYHIELKENYDKKEFYH